MVGIPSDGSILAADSSNCPVGVHYLPATDQHPPLRIFYPADPSAGYRFRRPVGWFQETGVVPYLMGYLHTMGAVDATSKLSQWLVRPCVQLLSWFFPLTWLRLPGVYDGATPVKTASPLPWMIFSHGLTGTGQENAALCAAWAQRGRMVVVGVHHTDGSSCCAPLKDGSILYYQKPPPYQRYDANFRPRQVQQRAQELLQAKEYLLQEGRDHHPNSNDNEDDPLLNQIRRIIDPQRIVATGYSYGAATVAQAIVDEWKLNVNGGRKEKAPSSFGDTTATTITEEAKTKTTLFQAAVFLDGWFHIDVQKSAGIALEFPPAAFDYLQQHDETWPVPSLFLNSQQFEGYTQLFRATQRLAQAAQCDITVLPDTGHQNFCDVIFWIPLPMLRKMMMGAIGMAEPVEAYCEIVQRTLAFLQEEQQGGSHEKHHDHQVDKKEQ